MNSVDLGALSSEVVVDAKTAIAQLSQFSAALKSASERLDQLGTSGEKTAPKIDKVEKGLSKAASVMNKVGTAMTKYVTAPILAAGTAVAKFSMDFDTAMAKVYTLAGGADRAAMKKELLELSNTYGIAAKELAEAEYEALSSDVAAADTIKLLDTAARSAKGGFTDVLTVVDGLTNVLNAYNLSVENADAISNQFLITQNQGKITYGQIADNIGKVAPTANSAGVAINELLASVASLTINGIAAEASMTGMKAALSNIIKPSVMARKEAERLGLDFSVSALQGKGWVKFLEDVQEKTQGDVGALGQLFRSTEALNTILTLTSQKGGEIMTRTLDEMDSNANALNDSFSIMEDTAGHRLQVAFNKLKNGAISFGDAVAPIIEGVAGAVGGLAGKLNAMDDGTKKTIVTTALVVAAAGPVLTTGAKVVTVINAIRTAMIAWGVSSKAVFPILGAIVLALTAIIATVTACVKAYREQNKAAIELKNATKEYAASMKEAADASDNAQKTAAASATVVGKYIDRLKELESQESRTNEEQREYGRIIDRIKGVMPDLNMELSTQNGLLKEGAGALEDQVRLWKEKAIAQALESQYAGEQAAVVALMVEKQKAEDALYDAQIQRAELVKQRTAIAAELQGMMNVTVWDEELSRKALELDFELSTLDSDIFGLDMTIRGLEKSTQTAGDALTEGEETLGKTQRAVEKVTDALLDNGEAADEATPKIEDYNDALDDGAKKGKLYADAIANGIKRISKESDNLKSATKNLKANNKDIEDFYENLGTMADKGFDSEIIQQLYDMGPAYGKLVKDMAKAGPEGAEEFLAALKKSNDLRAAADEFATTGASSGGAYADGVESGINANLERLYQMGVLAAQAVNSGFTETLEIQSPSRVAKRSAGFWADGVVGGVKGKLGEIGNSGKLAGLTLNGAFSGLRTNLSGIRGGTVPADMQRVINRTSNTHTTSNSRTVNNKQKVAVRDNDWRRGRQLD